MDVSKKIYTPIIITMNELIIKMTVFLNKKGTSKAAPEPGRAYS